MEEDDDSDTDADDYASLDAYFLNEWKNVKLKPIILWDCFNCNSNRVSMVLRSGKYPYRRDTWKPAIEVWQNNRIITIDFILANRNLEWNWNEVSHMGDLRMKHIIDNPDIAWDFSAISGIKDLSIDYVLANMHKKWNWENICNNGNLTMFDLQKYKTACANRGTTLSNHNMCNSPNLTTDFVFENKLDPTLSWSAIRKHRFTTEREQYVIAKRGHLCLHVILDDYETNPHTYGEFARTNGLLIAINSYLVKTIAKYVNP